MKNNNNDFNISDFQIQDDNGGKRIWWARSLKYIGRHYFTFDKQNFYNLFSDFPYKLTKEEIKIFIEDEPYWADFFESRFRKNEKTGSRRKIKI